MKKFQYLNLRASILIIIISLFYWLPILVWLLKYPIVNSANFSNSFFFTLFKKTFIVSFIVSLSSVILAYPMVFYWKFFKGKIATLISISMIMPLIMGLLARNYSWIGMFTGKDFISSVGWSLLDGKNFIYTEISVYLVMVFIFIPIAFFVLAQGFSLVSQTHLEAARTLGMPDWRFFPQVVIPMTLRFALLTIALNFALAVGYFITPNMIGGGKSDFISNAVLVFIEQGKFEEASLVTIWFLLIMTIPIMVISVLIFRQRTKITGR